MCRGDTDVGLLESLIIGDDCTGLGGGLCGSGVDIAFGGNANISL